MDETGEPGGLVRNAWSVENYPGMEPVPGEVLAGRLGLHLKRSGTAVARARVEGIERHGRLFECTGGGTGVRSRALVVSTGTAPLDPGIPGTGSAGGVYFAPREIPRPFPAEVAVAGGGEAAFDYAMTAAANGAETVIMVRGSSPRVAGRLLEAARGNRRIRILYDTTIGSVTRAEGRLALSAVSSGTGLELSVDALLIAVGRIRTYPETGDGLLVLRGNELLGSPGVFTAGDVRSGGLGQASTAAGQGVMAAGMAFDYLREEGT
jgi:thioredoxin reductase (NADPH)